MKTVCNSLNSNKNRRKIRNLALLEAVAACGGVKALALLIKVSSSTIYKWIKQVKMNIPYDVALSIEKHSKVSIDRLLPHMKKLNNYVKEKKSGNFIFKKIAKNRIIIADFPYISCLTEQLIIIDTNRVLISGLKELQAQKTNIIKVLTLDLNIFFLNIPFNYNTNNFLISELIAIGLRLENLIKNRKDQHYSLERIAKFLGFFKKAAYLQAKKYCLQTVLPK